MTAQKKKLHWTQMPENREKVQKLLDGRWPNRASSKKPLKERVNPFKEALQQVEEGKTLVQEHQEFRARVNLRIEEIEIKMKELQEELKQLHSIIGAEPVRLNRE